MNKLALVIILSSLPLVNAFSYESKFSVEMTSNYVFRGISQSNDKTVLQGAYQVSQEEDLGFYGGLFASKVTKGTEFDVYAGLALDLGNDGNFILDIGAIEYLYTDTTFAPASHEIYAGLQYESAYVKYYFGEENARYLDLGIGFELFDSVDLLFSFGQVSSTSQNGNNASVTLQKDFEVVRLGLRATYEDKTTQKDSHVLAYISTGF